MQKFCWIPCWSCRNYCSQGSKPGVPMHFLVWIDLGYLLLLWLLVHDLGRPNRQMNPRVSKKNKQNKTKWNSLHLTSDKDSTCHYQNDQMLPRSLSLPDSALWDSVSSGMTEKTLPAQAPKQSPVSKLTNFGCPSKSIRSQIQCGPVSSRKKTSSFAWNHKFGNTPVHDTLNDHMTCHGPVAPNAWLGSISWCFWLRQCFLFHFTQRKSPVR